LPKDALAGEQLRAQADHKTQHGQAAVPGFSEGHEAEAGGIRHGSQGDGLTTVTIFGGALTVAADLLPGRLLALVWVGLGPLTGLLKPV
jgi:hypothetical protein